MEDLLHPRQGKASPFSGLGLLVVTAFVMTRGPVLWVIRALVAVTMFLLRPLLFLGRKVIAWHAARQTLVRARINAERQALTQRGTLTEAV